MRRYSKECLGYLRNQAYQKTGPLGCFSGLYLAVGPTQRAHDACRFAARMGNSPVPPSLNSRLKWKRPFQQATRLNIPVGSSHQSAVQAGQDGATRPTLLPRFGTQNLWHRQPCDAGFGSRLLTIPPSLIQRVPNHHPNRERRFKIRRPLGYHDDNELQVICFAASRRSPCLKCRRRSLCLFDLFLALVSSCSSTADRRGSVPHENKHRQKGSSSRELPLLSALRVSSPAVPRVRCMGATAVPPVIQMPHFVGLVRPKGHRKANRNRARAVACSGPACAVVSGPRGFPLFTCRTAGMGNFINFGWRWVGVSRGGKGWKQTKP